MSQEQRGGRLGRESCGLFASFSEMFILTLLFLDPACAVLRKGVKKRLLFTDMSIKGVNPSPYIFFVGVIF